MIYYSTGISPYLPKMGATVDCNNDITVDILLKGGLIVKDLNDLEECKNEVAEIVEPIAEVIETVEQPVEKVVKVEKPKGRPKGKVVKKKIIKK